MSAMRLTARHASSAVLVAFAVLVEARPADACSCGRSCCGQVAVTPLGGRVPSNVPAFSWWPGPGPELGCRRDEGQVSDVRLLHLADGEELPVALALSSDAAGYLARPLEALVVGDRYRFVGGSLCPGTERFGPSARAVTFEVAPPAALPAALGTVAAGATRTGSLRVTTFRGSCDTQVTAAAAEVALRISADAQPWESGLLYETLVDGASWRHQPSLCEEPPRGASHFGRGRDVVYVVCQSDDSTVVRALSPGRHSVRFRATLPGASAPIESAPLEVDLRCGTPTSDAGLDYSEGGCQCTSVGGSHSRSGRVVALTALAALLVRRRPQCPRRA